MKNFLLALGALTMSTLVYSQTFTNNSALLSQAFNSGGCVGVVDMDQDGLDDVLILNDGDNLFVCYQEPDGTFTTFSYGSVSGSNQWGMAAGDVDNDGHLDVYSGGNGDGVHLVEIDSRGVYTLSSLPNGSMFMQGANMVDIDNDGWLDLFGCHDVGLSKIWQNDQTGGMVNTTTLIDLTNYDQGGYSTDHSGNYGSVWTDFDGDGDVDMFLAKCRQGVNDANDPRRINQLWVNDGAGGWTEDATARGLTPLEQSWTSDFADIDNDGDFDCLLTNHSTTMLLYENDGLGYFTDITAGSGLAISAFFLQAKFADLDNDGFVDLVYSGGAHEYMRNNGDNTFTNIPNTFPNSDTMHSFGIGDLNDDGALDVYSSYGNTYVNPDYSNDDILWLNDGNANNWVSFDLQGILSNVNAVGAKVKIFGAWGTQIREVRAGESYGIVTSFKCHFGLGSETAITSAEIQFPSGTTVVLSNPAINTIHNIPEADCLISGVTITPQGSTQICPGGSVILDAPAGYSSYDWSTGESTPSITATAQGNYSVVVTDASNCVGVSDPVAVDVVTPAAPEITEGGVTLFCEGSSVNLLATEGVSYLWSNGEMTQSIDAALSGIYTVDVEDICGSILTSPSVEVTVLAAPPLPDVADEMIPAPGTATFTGTSTNLQWFTAVDDVVPVATGNSYTTPFNASTTSYWVEDIAQYGGASESGGQINNSVDGQYHSNSNNWLLFDVHEDVILKSVKVYANGAGDRGIEVVDDFGSQIAYGLFTLPDGESIVTLDFTIPAGTNYGLRCTAANPQLWREGPPAALSYPYDISTLVTINSSTVSPPNATAYYYFFFDWVVETEVIECTGPRKEVQVIVAGELGCTDPGACNYVSTATTDDGSCDYTCLGCTDALACNFDSTATIDDGTCDYTCLGCTDPGACNFDSTATIDDGSCDYSCLGCTDTTACNYNSLATIDDGSCDFSCYGCTATAACNYNPAATIDDGTCYFNCAACAADFNGDGTVNTPDILILLGEFGCEAPANCETADLNGDGSTTVPDLLIFLGAFGQVCDQ